jgi:hypothetical protein
MLVLLMHPSRHTSHTQAHREHNNPHLSNDITIVPFNNSHAKGLRKELRLWHWKILSIPSNVHVNASDEERGGFHHIHACHGGVGSGPSTYLNTTTIFGQPCAYVSLLINKPVLFTQDMIELNFFKILSHLKDPLHNMRQSETLRSATMM